MTDVAPFVCPDLVPVQYRDHRNRHRTIYRLRQHDVVDIELQTVFKPETRTITVYRRKPRRPDVQRTNPQRMEPQNDPQLSSTA